MNYKHFYRAIIIRLLIIIFLSAGAIWLWFIKHLVLPGIIDLAALTIATVNIIRYFNNINRWMAFFLLGIENEDSSLKIPVKSGNKAIDEVYKGMQRLNELFRQAKMEINSQEQYFRSVINQSATGLFSVNDKGRIINLNPVAKRYTGLNEYHHVNTLQKLDNALPQFIINPSERETVRSAVFENRHGQKLLFKITEIQIGNEIIKLVAVSDISKELDSREVDAWIKLARTLSHEIMNNIAPITTLSQVISGYFTKGLVSVKPEDIDEKKIENTIKGLAVIEERSVGLLNFVDNYRKFTRLPEPDLKEVDIVSIIENNLMSAAAFSGFDNIKIIRNYPAAQAVLADEKLLSQVMTNLLKNAVEALVQNKTENPAINIKVTASARHVKTEIINNGPAIPSTLREQIFVPFFTTKEDGSGIGLSLSRQMMLSMGGDIVLNPEKTGGTSFALTLAAIFKK